MVEIFNNETDISEAIFNVTYLEDEVNIEDMEKMTAANILLLVRKDWTNRVHHRKGFKVQVIEIIA